MSDCDPPEGDPVLGEENHTIAKLRELLAQSGAGGVNTDIWITKDGEELSISEMHSFHLMNARTVLKAWCVHERRHNKRKELKAWIRAFSREITKREKAWQKQRGAHAKTGSATGMRATPSDS